MMHGRPLAAFAAQPAGAVLSLGTMMLLVCALCFGLTGTMLTIDWHVVGPVRTTLCPALLMLGGWAIKVAAGLLSGQLPAR